VEELLLFLSLLEISKAKEMVVCKFVLGPGSGS
jgi:hypothetical protein